MAEGEDHHAHRGEGTDLRIGNKLGNGNGNGVVHHYHKKANEKIQHEEHGGRGEKQGKRQKGAHGECGEKKNLANLELARKVEKEKISNKILTEEELTQFYLL